MKKYVIVFLFSVILSACVSTNVTEHGSDDLKELFGLMQGSFSSIKQSKDNADYYDIRLEMVEIWKDNGLWLYVEQAAASALERPYRQRVYHLTKLPDNVYKSAVYSLPNPLEYAGEWKKENPLAELSPSELVLREGCAVYLKRLTDGSFTGSTKSKTCKSTLRGASYANSIVEITKDGITSWDQGFDATDKQVWGAKKGPYIFLKK